MLEVGQRIQSLRVRGGLSQEALADRLGVSRQSVSKWELGQTMPDVEKIVQLSSLFGVSTDSLLLDEVHLHDSKQSLRFGMYLIVKNFPKAIEFYEKLLCTRAAIVGQNRFAQFFFDGVCIAIMNEAHLPGHDYSGSGGHKFAFNFSANDLSVEHERVKSMNIGKTTDIIYAHTNYYFFNVYDPDGNVIEITGQYVPK
jgi:transcriptional regulator with XRE-family HTH domain